MRRLSQSQMSAFTLVELVVVVVIIGVMAAVAIPRVSGATSQAAAAKLRADLSVLRNAIGHYTAEHMGALPAADDDGATFVKQLTMHTDALGAVGTTAGVHIYGPYLFKFPAISVGPNAGAEGVQIREDGAVHEEKTTVGWIFSRKTGRIFANTDDLDSEGVSYNTY